MGLPGSWLNQRAFWILTDATHTVWAKAKAFTNLPLSSAVRTGLGYAEQRGQRALWVTD